MSSTKNFEEFAANMARGYASTVTRLAKQYSESSRVRKTIHSKVDTSKAGKFFIRIWAGGQDAPDARAREYGSGVWARRGPKGKILIKPKNGKALVFPWEVATSPISGQISPNIPRLPDGRVILKQVEHPGISADNSNKGYIAPAANETRRLMRDRFRKEGRKAIVLDIRVAFKGARRAG